MSYYYRVSEEEVYGPVSSRTLVQWAKDGELDPALEIAESPEGPWVVSVKIDGLDMDWLVAGEEETKPLGPMHPLALAKLLDEETIAPDTEVTQVSTGETFEAVDVLCAVLMEQRELLQEQLDEARTQLQQQKDLPAQEPEATDATPNSDLQANLMAAQKEIAQLKQQLENAADDADLPDDLPGKKEWRDVMRTKDQLGKESEKWKKFFDDEAERSKKKEAMFAGQINTLKASEQEAADRIAQLEKKRRGLEERNFELKEAIARGATPDSNVDSLEVLNLKRSYNELHDKFELVLDQLKDRTEQLEGLYEQRDAIELEMRHKQDEMQESVQREREEAQKSRRQLVDLESSHRDLLLAYRDLNDRIVRDRNATSGMNQSRVDERPGRRRKKQKKAPPPPASTAEKNKEEPPPQQDAPKEPKPKARGGRAGKSRLKLT